MQRHPFSYERLDGALSKELTNNNKYVTLPLIQKPIVSTRRSIKSLLTSPQWLRQQVWSVSTEIVLSLFAAIGLVRGIPAGEVAVGLAIAYMLASIATLPLARGGKGRLAIVGVITVALGIMAATQDGKIGWWWLAGACGGLMAFRDSSSLIATAWSPWRAIRSSTTPISMVATAQALSIIIAAIATLSSAILQSFWPGWAALVVIFALAVGIPDSFMQRRRQPSERHPWRALSQSWRLPEFNNPEVRPLMTTAMIFTAAHIMGRRLLLPILMVALAKRAGLENQALVLVGGGMAVVSVLALLVKSITKTGQSNDPHEWFSHGIRANLFAWVALVILTWAHPYISLYIALPWLLIAWGAMEIGGRRWSVGYHAHLIAYAHDAEARRNRNHRELLSASTMAGNGISAGALVMGAIAPSALSVVMICLLAFSAWRLWKPKIQIDQK